MVAAASSRRERVKGAKSLGRSWKAPDWPQIFESFARGSINESLKQLVVHTVLAVGMAHILRVIQNMLAGRVGAS